MEREQLERMPISSLRALDIQDPKDEAVVQEVLREKLANEPVFDPNRKVYPSDATDFLTPETEAAFQREMSGYAETTKEDGSPLEEVKVDDDGTEADETVVEETSEPEESAQEVNIIQTPKVFCEFCTAKGPVKHLNSCTRPK